MAISFTKAPQSHMTINCYDEMVTIPSSTLYAQYDFHYLFKTYKVTDVNTLISTNKFYPVVDESDTLLNHKCEFNVQNILKNYISYSPNPFITDYVLNETQSMCYKIDVTEVYNDTEYDTISASKVTYNATGNFTGNNELVLINDPLNKGKFLTRNTEYNLTSTDYNTLSFNSNLTDFDIMYKFFNCVGDTELHKEEIRGANFWDYSYQIPASPRQVTSYIPHFVNYDTYYFTYNFTNNKLIIAMQPSPLCRYEGYTSFDLDWCGYEPYNTIHQITHISDHGDDGIWIETNTDWVFGQDFGGNHQLVFNTFNFEYFDIWIRRDWGDIASSTIRINKIDTCYNKQDEYQLYYLNEMGGWDVFKFTKKTIKTGKIERNNYKKRLRTNYKNQDRGLTNINTNVEEVWTLNTDLLNENEVDRFLELLKSPEVYIIMSGGYFAINLLTKDYTHLVNQNNDILQYSIQFKFANKMKKY